MDKRGMSICTSGWVYFCFGVNFLAGLKPATDNEKRPQALEGSA